MSLTRRSFSALSLGAFLAPGAARAHTFAEAQVDPAVIELFTSQGCSSCPPADALMVELSKERGVIPLTYPVEIWDYLGWKDTLAKPAFTRRQKAYAARVAGKRVYTPQAIINGSTHCVGSDFAAIVRLKSSSAPKSGAKLTLQASGDGWRARGSVPALDKPLRLVALPFRSRETVPIGRGENSGRTITYANVVRDIIDIGEITGNQFETGIARALVSIDKSDGFALLLQAGSLDQPGHILAAAMIEPGGARA